MNGNSKFVERQSEVRRWDDYTWARNEFVSAIQRTAPEVVKSLRDQLIQRFRSLVPRSKKGRRNLHVDYREQDLVLAELRPAIEAWANEHHLAGSIQSQNTPKLEPTIIGWMEPIILHSFLEWTVQDERRQPEWKLPDRFAVGAYMATPKPLDFNDEGWALLRESAISFRNRMTEKFDQFLDTYIQDCLPDEQTGSTGQEGSLPRLPTRVTSEHFDWLVMFQVQGVSCSEISSRFRQSNERRGVTRQAVMNGIKSAAEHILGPGYVGWLRQPSGGGRPKRKA